jgi:phage FluMu protein Com
MIQCEGCKRVLGTVQESDEIYVRGEVTLAMFCPKCSHITYFVLYEYNNDRIKRSCHK